jgi:TolB-like protein
VGSPVSSRTASPGHLPSRRRRAVTLVVACVLLAGLGVLTPPVASAGGRVTGVAVFPVENLTTDIIPADAVRQFLVDTLTAEGINVLDDDTLDAFMARHRVRYAAGIDEATAVLLREETGVDGIVVASVELSSAVVPPKIALFARLVSITDIPVVAWAEDVALSGDDAIGLFQLRLVRDYQVLENRAFEALGTSLVTYLRTGQRPADRNAASKYRPKSSYRGLTLEPGQSYSVAVVPFFNLSERRRAGEIMALLFMRQLSRLDAFRVLDIGVARRQLLNARIIMDGGLAVTDAETIASLVEADFVLAGRVIRYEDYEGPEGVNGVEFSATLIERRTRRVVWSSHSYNEGTDGVRFFGLGRTRTAHAMATAMVKHTTEAIADRGR